MISNNTIITGYIQIDHRRPCTIRDALYGFANKHVSERTARIHPHIINIIIIGIVITPRGSRFHDIVHFVAPRIHDAVESTGSLPDPAFPLLLLVSRCLSFPAAHAVTRLVDAKVAPPVTKYRLMQ
jgi:hypothetical protein